MSKKSHERQAVYVVTPAEDFRPLSPWSWPDEFSGGRLLAKNVSMTDARAMARAFNDRRMQMGRPVQRWAIAARFLRPNRTAAGGAFGVAKDLLN